MKKQFLITIIFVLLASIFTYAQDTDKIAVPLSDPSKPVMLEASLMSGGITVIGYDGKEVIVESKVREKKLDEAEDLKDAEKEALGEYRVARRSERSRGSKRSRQSKREKTNDKAKGMTRLNINSSGLTVEEENNVIEVSVDSWRRAYDLNIKVPRRTSLKLNCMNNGDILVENVEGEFEVENLNGAVTLRNVSGSVTAHSLNKDVTVTLNKVDAKKSMSFSTMNGDIDVTFPKNTKATLKLKSDMGDIYSDFDMSKHKITKKVDKKDSRGSGGKYKVVVENTMQVALNGGGSEMQFTSFNGDIYVRQGK
ncbi:hypothetical protein B6I21_09230 [candidate division KSB1 bacterium 4572_119]|nr:MAG: hypothetical protein B6I21_09230 [candidate division KSB1 bacterium 4572_119]